MSRPGVRIPAMIKAQAVRLLKAGTSVERVRSVCCISLHSITVLRKEHGITHRCPSGRPKGLKHVTKHSKDARLQTLLAPHVAAGNAIEGEMQRRAYFLTLAASLRAGGVPEGQSSNGPEGQSSNGAAQQHRVSA